VIRRENRAAVEKLKGASFIRVIWSIADVKMVKLFR
jgi:hypothetical protein